MAGKDYSEELFNAIDILMNKKIEDVKFDQTINVTITDASKAKDGTYTVTNGNATFVAYSSETTYQENDNVLVTIPQGNYDNQKVIIGKAVDNDNTPIIYRSPFQNLVNISNNLISKEDEDVEIEFLANSNDPLMGRPWGNTLLEFKDSEIYQYEEQLEDENHHSYTQTGEIWDSGDIFQQGYTRLGLRAQFSSWLSEYEPAYGDYGLALEITFKCLDLAEDNTFVKIVTLNSDEFFGDIYNFETYYTQEKVYNIADYLDYPIVRLRLFVYQRNNFKNIDNEYIYSIIPSGEYTSINPNLFVKSPYICLGIPIEDFQTDIANLITESSSSYVKSLGDTDNRTNNNEKIINLRWVHKFEKDDIVKAVEQGEFPKDYEVRWYRYKIGAKSPDQFSGAHWMRFYGLRTQMNKENGEWVLTEDEVTTNPARDVTTDTLQVTFQPNANLQQEQIKAIVIKHESETISRLVAISNILTFLNEEPVRNQTTLIDANALSIRYDDDEKGHYFLYNEAGDIGKNEDSEVRSLTAVFDEDVDNVYEKSELVEDECFSIEWIFPDINANTMIIPMTGPDKDAQPATWNGNGYWVDGNGVRLGQGSKQVGFTIKPHLNNTATQNTIRLEIVKDGQNYTAQIQPIFGTAGTNGSDYTLVLTWLNGKNGVDVSETNPTLEGELALYDQSGDVVDWPSEARINCSWAVAEVPGITSTRVKEQEENEIFYPVFKRGNGYALLYNQGNTSEDANYQPNNFYYFIHSSIQNNVDYYEFNLISKKFELVPRNTIQTANDKPYYYVVKDGKEKQVQLYIKGKKNKLEFRRIFFASEPLNDETGVITYHTPAIEVEDNKKNYYYSKTERYYIKYEDRYILDPWTDYQEVEAYFEPIEAKEKSYSTISGGNQIAGTLNVESDETTRRIIITGNGQLSMGSLFILKVTLTNFGDYDLVTYYPIPLKNNSEFIVDYIEGPDRVRYDSSGTLDFNKNPYQITTRKVIDNNLITYRHGYEPKEGIENLLGYWQLLLANAGDSFRPALNETVLDNTQNPPRVKLVTDNKYDIPLLSPVGVYIPDATPYGVQFVHTRYDLITSQSVFNNLTNVYNENGESITKGAWAANTYYQQNTSPLWTQPILVYENRYPSRTLNKWNGKDIVTDEDAGTISASGFSAGKKERDNSFTGVVIGDWSRSVMDTAIAQNTGIYGFYKGAMSYAFKDDGTGFIGKDGSGRIYLDGNKSQIFSSKWANQDVPEGMLLDVDDGYIKMQSTHSVFVRLVSNTIENDYFTTFRYGQHPEDDQLYLETSLGVFEPLQATDTFDEEKTYHVKENEESHPSITNEEAIEYFKTKTYGVHATNKLYNSSHVEISEFSTYNKNTKYYIASGSDRKFITLGSNQTTYPFSIGEDPEIRNRPFRIQWDGTAIISRGEFTGEIHAKGGSIDEDLTIYGTVTGGRFIADSITTNEGVIGGWTISANALYDGDTDVLYDPKIQNNDPVPNSSRSYTILRSGKGGIETVKGNIGGWTISDGKMYDGKNWRKYTQSNPQGSHTVLTSDPENAANIATNVIDIIGTEEWEGLEAQFGAVTGYGDNGPIQRLGLSSSSSGIIIQTYSSTGSSNSYDIGIRSAKGLYLDGRYQVTRTQEGDQLQYHVSSQSSISLDGGIVLTTKGDGQGNGGNLVIQRSDGKVPIPGTFTASSMKTELMSHDYLAAFSPWVEGDSGNMNLIHQTTIASHKIILQLKGYDTNNIDSRGFYAYGGFNTGTYSNDLNNGTLVVNADRIYFKVGSNYFEIAQGQSAVTLSTDISASNQSGIYARFA